MTVAQLLQCALSYPAPCPAQAVQQKRLVFIGGVPGDIIAQPVEGNIYRVWQMPSLKLPLAAHIDHPGALLQPVARRCWANQHQPFQEKEGSNHASNDDPCAPIHKGWDSVLNESWHSLLCSMRFLPALPQGRMEPSLEIYG
jgi:hypothetical protein